MDRTEDWRAFVHIAAHHSFARAAEHLRRSPQSITRAVAALEHRLGTRLFHRTTRSVSLTHDGERYLDRARRLVAELDALESPDRDPTLRGTLSVTAPVLFGQLHVMPVLTAFLAKHEHVTGRVVLVDRIVSLAEEAIDAAVRIGELPDSSLLARQLGHVRAVLVASPLFLREHGTPSSIDRLAAYPCIAFAGTSPAGDRWTFVRQSVAIQPRLIVNTNQAAIDAALAGLGIARVLSYQVTRLVASGRLRIVLADSEPPLVPVQLVTLPGVQPRIAVTFADYAAARLRKRLITG